MTGMPPVEEVKTRTAVRRLQSGNSSLQRTNENVRRSIKARASVTEEHCSDCNPIFRTISVAMPRCAASEQTIKTGGVLSISRLPRPKLPESRRGRISWPRLYSPAFKLQLSPGQRLWKMPEGWTTERVSFQECWPEDSNNQMRRRPCPQDTNPNPCPR